MDTLLTRSVDQIVGQSELEQAMTSGRKLRIKFGVDPTSPDLHIGHAVVLWKLRKFQDLGHTVIFLIGDYTTKIGDPSGKSKTRPMLTDSEIKINVTSYLDQVGKILNVKKAEVRYNSEWLNKLTFGDLIKLASNISVAQIIERDDFKNRLASGQELALHEIFYPLMQAYDSVALEADMEFGGSDQLFNLLAGRSLQKKLGQKPQIVFTCELLVGLDGVKKMSKSLDNYVSFTDTPLDMYGKVMSLPDNLIAPYYKLCTEIELAVIDQLVKTLADGANPRDSKASLAREIVRQYHGETAALKAESDWNKRFVEKELPNTLPELILLRDDEQVFFHDSLISAGIASSINEVRRLILQGGIKHNGKTLEPTEARTFVRGEALEFKDGDTLEVGKRRAYRVSLKKK